MFNFPYQLLQLVVLAPLAGLFSGAATYVADLRVELFQFTPRNMYRAWRRFVTGVVNLKVEIIAQWPYTSSISGHARFARHN
jgi:hypothetical protein